MGLEPDHFQMNGDIPSSGGTPRHVGATSYYVSMAQLAEARKVFEQNESRDPSPSHHGRGSFGMCTVAATCVSSPP
jgi:hypothetical protein